MITVTAVQLHLISEPSLPEMCEQLAESYIRDYPDDAKLVDELERASTDILEWMRAQFDIEKNAGVNAPAAVLYQELPVGREKDTLAVARWDLVQ